jgi:hypothetical protein
MSDLTPNKLDMNNDFAIPCPAKKCGAQVGEPCQGLSGNLVHFARRLKRILIQAGR